VAFAFCIFDEVREVEELLQSLTRCPDVLETRRQASYIFPVVTLFRRLICAPDQLYDASGLADQPLMSDPCDDNNGQFIGKTATEKRLGR